MGFEILIGGSRAEDSDPAKIAEAAQKLVNDLRHAGCAIDTAEVDMDGETKELSKDGII